MIRILVIACLLASTSVLADGPPFPMRCYPMPDVSLSAYKFDVAPDTYTSKWNKAVTFVDTCTKATVVQLYNDDELNALKWATFDIMKAVRAGLTISQAITVWAQAQPIRYNTPEEDAWVKVLKAKYAAPVPVCKVTAQSATVSTRQVYKANAAKTGPGTAITGVRVAAGTSCDPAQRLGMTNYYFVPSVNGYAIGAVQ